MAIDRTWHVAAGLGAIGVGLWTWALVLALEPDGTPRLAAAAPAPAAPSAPPAPAATPPTEH
jgi:hypothetical protein